MLGSSTLVPKRVSFFHICALRGEDAVVLGNAGVVRVERIGREVELVREGDLCLVFGNAVWDEHGDPVKIMAYDAPGTMGVLARTMKLNQRQLIPIPTGSTFTLQQWAAFSLRDISAWANWRVAYACWQSQMLGVPPEETIVCAWGDLRRIDAPVKHSQLRRQFIS